MDKSSVSKICFALDFRTMLWTFGNLYHLLIERTDRHQMEQGGKQQTGLNKEMREIGKARERSRTERTKGARKTRSYFYEQ